MKLIAALAATLIATTAYAADPPTPVAERAPDAAVAPKPPKPPKPAAALNPNLVEAKTASGKTIHYDCSKKGNATKTACKK